MPPIMGAAAFLLADFTNIPYSQVAIAAAIPALLYYLGLFFAVDLESVRLSLQGFKKSEMPNFFKVLREGWLFLIPIFIILYMIFKGFTPIKAGAYAFFATLAISYVKKATRLPFSRVMASLEQGAKNLTMVAISCAAAGIVVGIVGLTGIGLKMTELVVLVSGHNLFIALIFAAIAALILGLGLPASAAYVVEAVIVIPALIQMGASVLAANLFIFYFAIIGAITPPEAVASYAAAGIAGANPMQVGWTAMRLAIPAYIVPFMFVYAPELLLKGTSILEGIIVVITATVGIFMFAVAGAGHFYNVKLNWVLRVVACAAAGLLIIPGFWTDLLGLTGSVLVAWLTYFKSKPKKVAA